MEVITIPDPPELEPDGENSLVSGQESVIDLTCLESEPPFPSLTDSTKLSSTPHTSTPHNIRVLFQSREMIGLSVARFTGPASSSGSMYALRFGKHPGVVIATHKLGPWGWTAELRRGNPH